MAYYNTSSAYDFGVFERPVHTAAEEALAHRAAHYFTHAGFIPADDKIPSLTQKTKQ